MTVVDSLAKSALKSLNAKQLSREKAWDNLKNLSQQAHKISLAELFKKNPNRGKEFVLTVGELSLDYSKNFIDHTVLEALLALADQQDLEEAIVKLMEGFPINETEKRPALHTALRSPRGSRMSVEGEEIMGDVLAARSQMGVWVEKLHHQKYLGATGKPIQDVVNIGIGGSDLGPQMLSQALKPFWQKKINVHYVANIDPHHFESVVAKLNPETTLFVISSKSFSTPESLQNAACAKKWLENKIDAKKISSHFMAITANPEKAQSWGIAKDHILPFWAWVGGRFSIWSSIGFPVALLIGMKAFEQFLQGGHEMDKHFKTAPLSQNMPVILGLLGVWYRNFWECPTVAICPYSYLLNRFPAYLQQLDMESNGKSYQSNGKKALQETGPILWGGEGTNAQHAFYQLLHQGNHLVPVDFIVALKSNTDLAPLHQQLFVNCLAQAKALMEGDPKQNMPGNKPSNLIVLNEITPFALGQLIALYEHKIFVQGVIWQINSFDQPGVELGKQLANALTQMLETRKMDTKLDSSTRYWLEKLGK